MAESLAVEAERLSVDAERLRSTKDHHKVHDHVFRNLEDCGYNISAHNWLEKNYWWAQYQYYLHTLLTCHFLVNRPGSGPPGGGVDWGSANQTAPANQQQTQHRGTTGGIIGELGGERRHSVDCSPCGSCQ